MEYEGYGITAEVECLEEWDIDENGKPTEKVDDLERFEVVGYWYSNEDTDDRFFSQVSQSDMEQHKMVIDDRLKELEKEQ